MCIRDSLKKIWPLHYPGQSDSATFDNALELLVMGGYSMAQAVMLLIPEAWEDVYKRQRQDRLEPARHYGE